MLEEVHHQLWLTDGRAQQVRLAGFLFSHAKLNSIGVVPVPPCCEVVAADGNERGCRTLKALHVEQTDAGRRRSLTVAAEFAQIHDMDPFLETC